MDSWLFPATGADGTLTIESSTTIPIAPAPNAMLAEALAGLEQSGTGQSSWIAINVVAGTDPLVGNDAERFLKATEGLGVSMLSRADDAYLRALRGTLENLAQESALDESLACLPLLIQARGA